MAETNAPAPTLGDNLSLSIDDVSLTWTMADVTEIVAMAQLKPNESVLVLCCGTAGLVIEALGSLGADHGRVVGVDPDHGMLQQAVVKLEAHGMYGAVSLLRGDVYKLDLIAEFQGMTPTQSSPTFDVIFARNALPPSQPACVAALQHWAKLLHPATGRMVATFAPTDAGEPHLAGMKCVLGGGDVLASMTFMFEEDWARVEEDFRGLAVSAGLSINGMRRVSFLSEVPIDMAAAMHHQSQTDFTGMDNKDPLWVDAHGTPTLAFKRAYLWSSFEKMAGELKRQTLDGVVGELILGPRGQAVLKQMENSMEIVPIIVKVAVLLKQI